VVRPFEPSSEDPATYVAGLSTPERLVLAQVTGDVVELLGGEESLYEYVEDDEQDASGADAENGPGGTGAADAPVPGVGDDAAHAAIRELFDGMDDEPVRAPTDPAVRRLIPDASSDPEIAREFRRFTDDDLRAHKVERLLLFAQMLLEAAPSRDESRQLEFRVQRDEAQAVAGALADIRLVIGERLDLRTDEDSQELYDSVTASWGAEGDVESGEENLDELLDDAAEDGRGPRVFLGSVFLLAGYMQESLTDCLLRDFRREKRLRRT